MTTLAIIILIAICIGVLVLIACLSDSPGEFFMVLAGIVIGIANWAADVIVVERRR
ncbi:hypothetical protein [Arthrobacter woluwensis]|uniref:hypothetical protein n=1 Tax=Arthrobacter woluwensis TaxID=156980 RepID=UPI001AAF617D|nr:hypothetical protein [Arthrobacter woluwensis]QTF71256.1 hypothetical protein G8758_03970 [Arthrobacter woluwensis]